jgi:type I restriction enzyme S subunit
MAPLDEVAHVVGGGTPSRAEPAYWNGRIPWATPTDLTKLPGRYILKTASSISERGLAASSAKLLPPGSVLMTSRATIGVCAINTTPMATNQGFQNLVPREGTDVEYLFYALSNKQAELIKLAAGSTFLEVSRRSVARLAVSLPPLSEQRKIAAILSAVDEAIEATQAVIDQLQVVKKAIMVELLMRGLPGRHSTFIASEIGIIPQGWTTATYAELAAPVPGAIQSGPFGSAMRHSEFVADGRLVVGIDNVLDGRFSLGSNHRITREKFEELRRFQARPLDLLITVMATIGRCCVVPADVEPCIITKHVYRLTVDQRKADPFFLMYCLYGIERLAAEVRGSAQGLSRPGLNKSLLLPLRFPLPPLAEQREIVAVLGSVDKRLADEGEASSAMRPLKVALMNAVLSGEVRVGPSREVA